MEDPRRTRRPVEDVIAGLRTPKAGPLHREAAGALAALTSTDGVVGLVLRLRAEQPDELALEAAAHLAWLAVELEAAGEQIAALAAKAGRR